MSLRLRERDRSVKDNDPVSRHEVSVEHDKFQIVEVPLDDPEDAQVIADVPLEGGHSCHASGSS